MASTRSQKSSTASSSSSSSKSSKPAKLTRTSVLISTSITTVILAILAALVANDHIRLNGNISPESLNGLGSRLEFTFRFLSLGVTWLIFCATRIGIKRLNSNALNPLGGYDHLIEADQRILQNSLEQWIISAFAQLALVCHLTGPEAARVIPFLNLSFLIGRILFWLGYPNRRSYGFITTALPSYLAAVYAVAKLIQVFYVP